MYLKVNLDKEVHLLNRRVGLSGLHQFVKASFKSVPEHFELTYLDPDNDTISLSNQDDLATLYSTLTEGFTKVTVHRLQEGDEQKVSPQVTVEVDTGRESQQKDACKATQATLEPRDEGEALLKQQPSAVDMKGSGLVFDVSTEQMQQNKPLEKSDLQLISRQAQPQLNVVQASIDFPVASQNCGTTSEKLGSDQLGVGINEPCQPVVKDDLQVIGDKHQSPSLQVAQGQDTHEDQKKDQVQTVVVGKLEQLVPSIVQRVRKALRADETSSQVTHPNVRCNQCSVLPIRGVRYQCLMCKEYNLCQKCQDCVVHTHDLLKIRKGKQRYVEKRQVQDVKQPVTSTAKQEVSGLRSQTKTDAITMKSIIASVQEVTGVSKESEEFARANFAEGVDRVIDLWFSR